MMTWVVRTIANACGLAVAAWLLSGITVTGDDDTERLLTLLVVALVFGVVNEFVRPIVSFLSIPLYILTLGLFFFVVNALMLMLTGWLSDQFGLNFEVDGFWSAVWGGIIISIVTSLVGMVLPTPERHPL
jgi:putative membrane protein